MTPLTETKLAEKFTEVINYPLLIPNNTSQAGWPDRLIQLPNSRIVACELKVVVTNRHNIFHLVDFRQTQAAWMANWQRRKGLGFLLVGINDQKGFFGYSVFWFKKWNDWLQVNSRHYSLDGVSTMAHMRTVKDWFDDYVDERKLIDA